MRCIIESGGTSGIDKNVVKLLLVRDWDDRTLIDSKYCKTKKQAEYMQSIIKDAGERIPIDIAVLWCHKGWLSFEELEAQTTIIPDSTKDTIFKRNLDLLRLENLEFADDCPHSRVGHLMFHILNLKTLPLDQAVRYYNEKWLKLEQVKILIMRKKKGKMRDKYITRQDPHNALYYCTDIAMAHLLIKSIGSDQYRERFLANYKSRPWCSQSNQSLYISFLLETAKKPQTKLRILAQLEAQACSSSDNDVLDRICELLDDYPMLDKSCQKELGALLLTAVDRKNVLFATALLKTVSSIQHKRELITSVSLSYHASALYISRFHGFEISRLLAFHCNHYLRAEILSNPKVSK